MAVYTIISRKNIEYFLLFIKIFKVFSVISNKTVDFFVEFCTLCRNKKSEPRQKHLDSDFYCIFYIEKFQIFRPSFTAGAIERSGV